jgi:hypothetical protein
MEREFDNTKLNLIVNILKERVHEISYMGDMSDLGNEIGYAVGKVYQDMNKDDANLFMIGFKHGISLTNKMH